MASTSSPADCGIVEAAARVDITKLKEKREEIGDEGKFRRMCDEETDHWGLFLFSNYKVLHAAAGMGEFEVCKFLVEEVGVDIDVKTDRGDTPLLLAIVGGHVGIAKYLIERGADITMTDSVGFTALHCALLHANKELLIMLLEKGADIEADSVGGTPLHCAAKLGSPDIVNFLLENNAKPNSVPKYLGISPLISAIYSDANTVECVELLLKAKADPNKLANGLSPLAHAIEAKSNSCIDSLIAGGADVDLVSSCGLRPIEHAALVNNVEASDILVLAKPGILATLNSVKAKKRRDRYYRNLKQNGDHAWDEQNYSSAIASYTEAIHHNISDEKAVANRSLCWARLGEAAFALQDAGACVILKPNWAKSHLREASAWHLLERYRMSSDAFYRAYELAPENEKIDKSARV